jgi:hypothetical protein
MSGPSVALCERLERAVDERRIKAMPDGLRSTLASEQSAAA